MEVTQFLCKIHRIQSIHFVSDSSSDDKFRISSSEVQKEEEEHSKFRLFLDVFLLLNFSVQLVLLLDFLHH
jgi:hypothetical protein